MLILNALGIVMRDLVHMHDLVIWSLLPLLLSVSSEGKPLFFSYSNAKGVLKKNKTLPAFNVAIQDNYEEILFPRWSNNMSYTLILNG